MKKLPLLLMVILLFTTSYAPPPDDLTDILIDGKKCGPHGSAKEGTKEHKSNVFKNRFDFPESADIDGSIDLEKISKAKENQPGFDNSKAVDIEGYVVEVKPGGKETCNCKTTKVGFKDTHIEIVVNPNKKDATKRVIVEVTPRIRRIMQDQGIDWSTSNLKQSFKNKFVKIQGWLFYDVSHDKENYADDPDDDIGRSNWRATSWEIHPVTYIDVLPDDDNDDMDITFASGEMDEGEDEPGPTPMQPLVKSASTTSNSNENKMNTNQTPTDLLVLIVLGAILGMVGQGLRVVVGLKKMRDLADASSASTNDLYQASRVIMSLLIACAIGAIAGVIAAVTKMDTHIDKSVLIAFITAGYAGTDFIEGFIRKEGASITKAKGTANLEKGPSPV